MVEAISHCLVAAIGGGLIGLAGEKVGNVLSGATHGLIQNQSNSVMLDNFLNMGLEAGIIGLGVDMMSNEFPYILKDPAALAIFIVVIGYSVPSLGAKISTLFNLVGLPIKKEVATNVDTH